MEFKYYRKPIFYIQNTKNIMNLQLTLEKNNYFNKKTKQIYVNHFKQNNLNCSVSQTNALGTYSTPAFIYHVFAKHIYFSATF